MRRRLTALVAGAMALVLVAFLVPLAILVRTVATERAVQQATGQAQLLSNVVATTDRASLDVAVARANADGDRITIFLDDGTVLGAEAERSDTVELAASGTSFSAETAGGREILFSTQDDAGSPAVVRAVVTDAEMMQGVVRSWVILAGLGLVLLLLGLLVTDRLARALVRPIEQVASVSHRLAAGDLDARTADEGTVEVREVGRALNHLAERIRDLLREERENVADLSHRLRTPLTALRLDAEQLPDHDDAARIGGSVDALERAVTQVIQEARSRAAGTAAGLDVSCDAAAVVRDRVDFWQVLADDTDRAVDVELEPGPIMVRVGAGDLEACVDAVLGNVFAHTDDGTRIRVTLRGEPDGGARLVVEDAGGGLPTALLAAGGATRRGDSGGGSTGLGLDIARRTAAAAGGSFALGRSDLGGAEVVVVLGPATVVTPAVRGDGRLLR